MVSEGLGSGRSAGLTVTSCPAASRCSTPAPTMSAPNPQQTEGSAQRSHHAYVDALKARNK